MTKYRTLARILNVDDDENVWVVFPAWNTRTALVFPRDLLRKYEVDVYPGTRFYCQFPLGENDIREIDLYTVEPLEA